MFQIQSGAGQVLLAAKQFIHPVQPGHHTTFPPTLDTVILDDHCLSVNTTCEVATVVVHSLLVGFVNSTHHGVVVTEPSESRREVPLFP